MKTILFLGIILLSGCIAGIVHGLVNLALVEPYLDTAIGIENQHMFSSGEANDTPEFWAEYYSYRAWQKGGEVLAGAILGTSIGALFGIVFAYSKNALPGNNFVKKALVLSVIMWAVIYIIPFAKYPANPPTVGDPETIILRQTLYLSFIAISGFSALGFYQLYKRLDKKFLAFVGYAAFISAVFVAMPANPDPVTAPQELVDGFRATSLVGASAFWLVVALVLGALWQRFQPDKIQQQKIQ
ncbi:MAG: CbtA family protein [Candidatus Nitrosotenuis sp.]